jgi:thioesterase domain-containing protein
MAQVELLIQLETEFGRELAPEDLATLPDIAALADWLDAARPGRTQTFVIALPWALNPLPPELIRAIAGDSVPMVIPLLPDGLDVPETAIATLADQVVARIAARTTGEPVVLAGYSFGGIVAAETATRLAAAGHAVAMLVLLDADSGKPTLATRIAGRLARLTRRSPASAPTPLDAILGQARRAVAHWRPATLPMPVVAIHSTDAEILGAKQWHRWSVGEFRGACVPGSHLDLVYNPITRPQVASFIARARADLLSAQQQQVPLTPILFT